MMDDLVTGTDDGRAGLGEEHGVLGHRGAALGGVVGVVAAEAEDVARRVLDRRQQSHPLERVGQLALRQLLDRLLVHETLAVIPGLVRQEQRGLAALDQLEQALREAAAAAPDGSPLRGQVSCQAAQVQHGFVPHGARLGLTAPAAEGHEVHGYSLTTAAPLRSGRALPPCRAMSSSSRGRPKRTSSSTTWTSRTPTRPACCSALTTSVTRNSGVEAPAVTPTRLEPSNHSGLMSFLSL